MQIQISARHGQLDDASRDRIEEKAQKLVRFFDRLTSITVTVDLAHLEQPVVEVRATAEHHDDFVGTETASNIGAAMDGALQKVEVQLKKHKEKLTGHRAASVKHIETPERPADEQ